MLVFFYVINYYVTTNSCYYFLDSTAVKDDLDSSCSEKYDSDADNEYVPESETSSDSDEHSATKGRPIFAKFKVRNKRIVDLPEGNMKHQTHKSFMIYYWKMICT